MNRNPDNSNQDDTMSDNTTDEAEEQASENVIDRRQFMAAGAGAVLGSGMIGYAAGEAEADSATAPSGTVGSASDPFERIYADRLVFVERTSDPSSPADGTIWYNSDA